MWKNMTQFLYNIMIKTKMHSTFLEEGKEMHLCILC